MRRRGGRVKRTSNALVRGPLIEFPEMLMKSCRNRNQTVARVPGLDNRGFDVVLVDDALGRHSLPLPSEPAVSAGGGSRLPQEFNQVTSSTDRRCAGRNPVPTVCATGIMQACV